MQQLPEEQQRIEVVTFSYTMKRTRTEAMSDLQQARERAEDLRAGGQHVEIYRVDPGGQRERIQ